MRGGSIPHFNHSCPKPDRCGYTNTRLIARFKALAKYFEQPPICVGNAAPVSAEKGNGLAEKIKKPASKIGPKRGQKRR